MPAAAFQRGGRFAGLHVAGPGVEGVLPNGQRAGLVEPKFAGPGEALEYVATVNEDSTPRRLSLRDGDSERGGETSRHPARYRRRARTGGAAWNPHSQWRRIRAPRQARQTLARQDRHADRWEALPRRLVRRRGGPRTCRLAGTPLLASARQSARGGNRGNGSPRQGFPAAPSWRCGNDL